MQKLYKDQIKNNPHFCIMPFAHSHVSTEGEVALCCLAAYRYDCGDRPNVRQEKDLQAHWTSDWYKERRQRMLDGEALPECRTCWKQDKQGPGSDRTTANHMVLNHWTNEIDDNWDINVETGNTYNTPLWTDIRPGHTCNYKCRMCTPGVSDSIDKEQLEHTDVYKETGAYLQGVSEDDPKHVTGLTFKEMSKWIDDPVTRASLHKWIESEHYVTMKLIGGEPLATPGCVKLIQWCVDSGNTNFNLAITTNGSIAKGKILNLLDRFKGVRIDFSGDSNLVLDPLVNEYQRKNAISSVMHKNFMLFNTIDNCSVNYLCATGLYNIFNIVNVLEYWYTYGMLNKKDTNNYGKLIINLIEYPEEFNIELLPEQHRMEIADQIQLFLQSPKFVSICNEAYGNIEIFTKSSRLDLLINRLRKPLLPDNKINALRKKFVKRTVAFDKIRQDSFRNSLNPKIVQLIDEWCDIND